MLNVETKNIGTARDVTMDIRDIRHISNNNAWAYTFPLRARHGSATDWYMRPADPPSPGGTPIKATSYTYISSKLLHVQKELSLHIHINTQGINIPPPPPATESATDGRTVAGMKLNGGRRNPAYKNKWPIRGIFALFRNMHKRNAHAQYWSILTLHTQYLTPVGPPS